MRPGWEMLADICQAIGVPTENLIGMKIDAWDPNEAITLTTQHYVGIVDNEVAIAVQRWVPDGEPVRS